MKTSNYSNFKDLTQSFNKWEKFSLSHDVNKKLFEQDFIFKSINKAYEEILSLIEKYPRHFTLFNCENDEISSDKLMEGYIKRLIKKIQNYKESKYFAKYTEAL